MRAISSGENPSFAANAIKSDVGCQSGARREPDGERSCLTFFSVSVSVSVSVSGGDALALRNVASALRCRSRCWRDRSVLLSLSYWRFRHAAITLPDFSPISSNAARTRSIVATGSPSIAATRRAVVSNRPASFVSAALSKSACQTAMHTDREHSATSPASPILASLTVPAYARYQRLTPSPADPMRFALAVDRP